MNVNMFDFSCTNVRHKYHIIVSITYKQNETGTLGILGEKFKLEIKSYKQNSN